MLQVKKKKFEYLYNKNKQTNNILLSLLGKKSLYYEVETFKLICCDQTLDLVNAALDLSLEKLQAFVSEREVSGTQSIRVGIFASM